MKIYAAYYRRRYHRSPLKKIAPVVVSFLLLAGFIFFANRKTTPEIISPYVQASQIEIVQEAPRTKKKTAAELQQRIEAVLNDTVPEYSIIVEDFTRQLSLTMGDQVPFEGASIHKIAILLAIAKEIQLNNLSWQTTVTFTEQDRQDYGTGSLRYKRANRQYSIQELCRLMMEESDNTAAFILARRVLSFDKIEEHLTSWSITSTSMKENTTTNEDMKRLLYLLFTRALFPAELTSRVIDLMDDSIYEDRIPGKLPTSAKVYHKIGTAIAGLHDVGVVVTPTSMYYIGIFTKGVSDEKAATETIATISRAVFDYLEE